MTKSDIRFTLLIILADNLLNWTLGIVLTFFSKDAWALIFSQPLISLVPTLSHQYVLPIGVCFLVFAAWQVKVFLMPWKLAAQNLRVAAWLAWVPAGLLTIGLLLPRIELFVAARVLLWIGNVYMVWLGWWYWRVAKKIE